MSKRPPKDNINERTSMTAPKWYLPVTILALLWNLLGCIAALSDLRLTQEDIARMNAAQQALYAARPGWAIAATAIAVLGGTVGCLGLILRRRWALPLLLVSLGGLILQDVGLFFLSGVAHLLGPGPVVIQSLVMIIAIALVLLARKAASKGWLLAA